MRCQAAEPGIRVVLLQNGNVLRGQLVSEGEFVEILTEGAAIRLRQSDIRFDAASLLDVYEQQRRSVDRPTAAKHLELADWCMQHNLWPQAARELLDARGLDAKHPRVTLLEQRLAFLNSNLLSSKSMVAERVAERVAKRAGPKLIASQEQVAEAKSIHYPPRTLELFTRRIQPMLVNNCTSVGCHREEGPCEYQLSRALLYGESNQRTTHKNLQATLHFIDQQVPIDSPLLTIPLRQHGGAEGSIFPPHRRRLYDQLVAWVKLATADGQTALAKTQPAPVPETPVVEPASYLQPRSAMRGSPRVRFGARRPANQMPRPLDPETVSRRITSEGAAEQSTEHASLQE